MQPSPYTNMYNCNNGAQHTVLTSGLTLSNVPGQHLQLFHVISENSLSLTLRNMMVQDSKQFGKT